MELSYLYLLHKGILIMGLVRRIVDWGEYQSLNESWLKEHDANEGHGLHKMIHTEFCGSKGITYKVIRCYRCKVAARIAIGEIKAPPPSKLVKETKTDIKNKSYGSSYWS